MTEHFETFFVSGIYDKYSPDRMAITTKDTGEPSGRNNSTGRRKDVEDREEANDTDEELT